MRSSPLAGVRVLLVDDDELVREALHDYFVECGAVVVAAASARAALKAFMQAPPDVLVSDLRMPPGEDGFWLIAAIRALKPSQGCEVPAVAVTGDRKSTRLNSSHDQISYAVFCLKKKKKKTKCPGRTTNSSRISRGFRQHAQDSRSSE